MTVDHPFFKIPDRQIYFICRLEYYPMQGTIKSSFLSNGPAVYIEKNTLKIFN